jgi:hypothetical protein
MEPPHVDVHAGSFFSLAFENKIGEKKAPAITLSQLRILLEVVLPLRTFEWIKRWKWCDGFSTRITLLISRIEKEGRRDSHTERNIVVELNPPVDVFSIHDVLISQSCYFSTACAKN